MLVGRRRQMGRTRSPIRFRRVYVQTPITDRSSFPRRGTSATAAVTASVTASVTEAGRRWEEAGICRCSSADGTTHDAARAIGSFGPDRRSDSGARISSRRERIVHRSLAAARRYDGLLHAATAADNAHGGPTAQKAKMAVDPSPLFFSLSFPSFFSLPFLFFFFFRSLLSLHQHEI